MLSDIERREIEEELQQYPDRRAGVIDALKRLQERRGWISDDSVQDVAALLGMTGEEVESVATFYSLIFRRPVGRHVVFVCDSISCWIMGYERLQEQFKEAHGVEIGQTTRDGRLTLLPVACLGHCERAPALMVDRDVYGNVLPEKLAGILERYQ